MTPSSSARPSRKRVDTHKLLLDAIALNARALKDTQLLLTRLIVRAAKSGVPQTAIAKAAGVSQAHVSRTIAADRQANGRRKAARAPEKGERDGRV